MPYNSIIKLVKELAMAKRRKKSSLPIGTLLTGIACIMGIAAVCMMFLDAIETALGTVYTGVQTAFGYTESLGPIKTEILSPNVLAMLAYLLPVAGIVVALVGIKSKLLSLISCAIFAVAGVFAFLMTTTFPATVIGSDWVQIEASLAIGAILCGVFSLIAAACELLRLVFKK